MSEYSAGIRRGLGLTGSMDLTDRIVCLLWVTSGRSHRKTSRPLYHVRRTSRCPL